MATATCSPVAASRTAPVMVPADCQFTMLPCRRLRWACQLLSTDERCQRRYYRETNIGCREQFGRGCFLTTQTRRARRRPRSVYGYLKFQNPKSASSTFLCFFRLRGDFFLGLYFWDWPHSWQWQMACHLIGFAGGGHPTGRRLGKHAHNLAYR